MVFPRKMMGAIEVSQPGESQPSQLLGQQCPWEENLGAPTLPQHPFLFSSREGSLYTAALASDHLSQGQERLSQEILHQDMESRRPGGTGDAESQPSPGDTVAPTSVFQDGRTLEASPCLCFKGGGRSPQANSASWSCCQFKLLSTMPSHTSPSIPHPTIPKPAPFSLTFCVSHRWPRRKRNSE